MGTVQDPSGNRFCKSCSAIDFDSIANDNCLCYEKSIAASSVHATITNKACPSCRLITHLIFGLPDLEKIPLGSQVELWIHPYTFHKRGSTNFDSKLHPKCIHVRLCTHKMSREGEEWVSRCRMIGSLLPVRKDGSHGDTGARHHGELFSTLRFEGAIHVRPIPRKVDISLLRAWIDFCEHCHTRCEIVPLDVDGKTRLRFIDVLERRLVTSSLKERYVALSYVWGEQDHRVLTKDSLKDFQEKESLTPEVIPRIIFDAMNLVGALGERYLWVDTVCIIQNDDHDKKSQLPLMDSIYSHARLTIIAAVNSANDPLPRWYENHHMMPFHSELLNETLYATAQPDLETALKETAWSRRGWTFQEGLLSRRALIFTRGLVYWNCREEHWCEDQHTESHDVKQEPTAATSLFATHLVEGCSDHKWMVTTKILCAIGEYMQKAQDYSARLFSDYSDIVWAFSGVLRNMKDNFPRGYIWGLPYDQLDIALLWQTCCTRGRNLEHRPDHKMDHRLLIPSWCWIGKGHRVWYEPDCCSTISCVTWHEPLRYTMEDDEDLEGEYPGPDPRPPTLASPESPRVASNLLHFGHLCFTAETTSLFLELNLESDTEDTFAGYASRSYSFLQKTSLVPARIHLPSGREVGQIRVPVDVFRDGKRQRREFALLSKFTGVYRHDSDESDEHEVHPTKAHREECTHEPALNVMLVEWVRTSKYRAFAIRVALGRVEPSAWDEVEAVEKRIILG